MSAGRGTVALVLAGGFGTRLRSVVSDRPKVLAEVKGRPFLTLLLDQIARAGVQRVVLCTGYMAEEVERLIGKRYADLSIAYSVEREPLGTGGALRLAALSSSADTVLALNGDSYCDVDLGVVIDTHLASGAAGTLVLREVGDTSRYGRVESDENGGITQFQEKGAAGPGWINAGIYVLSRALLLGLSADRAVSLERDAFAAWLPLGLRAFRTGGRFLDIGTPESYAEAESFFSAG